MGTYEETFRKFLEVRDALFEEMAQDPYCLAAKAYRKCFSVPLIFYKDKGKETNIKELKEMVIQ